MKLEKCCKTLQSGCSRLITSRWKYCLQEEYDLLQRFLYPTNDIAATYPFTPDQWWNGFEVITEPDGKIVGVDKECSRHRIDLTEAEVLLYTFDLITFRREMCENFGLKPQTGEIDKWDYDIHWGTWEPEKGTAFPVTFFASGSRKWLRERVMEQIVLRKAAGEIVITPSRKEWNGDLVELAWQHKILLVPLDDILLLESGKLQPAPEWNDYLIAFCKMVEMDLPSSLLRKPLGNLFAKKGEWKMRFVGKEISVNGKLLGPAFIRQLMLKPNQEVHVEQLWREVFGNSSPNLPKAEVGTSEDWDSFLGSGEEAIDATGRNNLRNRLLELRQERTEAEAESNTIWLEGIDSETKAISAQLNAVVGKSGKIRKVGDERDKLRKRITKNISKTINIIRKDHPELADHLGEHVRTGEYMSYRPSTQIEWLFD